MLLAAFKMNIETACPFEIILSLILEKKQKPKNKD